MLLRESAQRVARPFRIVLASWAPFYAGAEVATEHLADGLQKAGHEVLVLVGTDGQAAARFRNCGLDVRFVEQQFTSKLGWFRYRRSMRKVVELLRERRPDIVHSTDLPTHQMISDAARRLNLPRVCHHRWIFDGAATEWFNKFGAERHIFVSRYLESEMTRTSPSLQASSRAVVHDGIRLPPLSTADDKGRVRRALGLPEDRKIVLFVGQVVERKGVADLLRAWSLLRERHNGALLVIVGDDLQNQGAYRREMEALNRELGDIARFVGFQFDITSWQTAADIAVVPSHTEPLGLVVLEAMSRSLPVIGASSGGIPEMIIHDETGLLVPPHSPSALAAALMDLLTSPDRCERFGNAGRRRCEEAFQLNSHVDAIVEQYEIVSRRSIRSEAR